MYEKLIFSKISPLTFGSCCYDSLIFLLTSLFVTNMSLQSVKNLTTDLKPSRKVVNLIVFGFLNSIKEEFIEFDELAESVEYLRASSNIAAEATLAMVLSISAEYSRIFWSGKLRTRDFNLREVKS